MGAAWREGGGSIPDPTPEVCSLKTPQAAELQDKAQDFPAETLWEDMEDWEKETKEDQEKLGRRNLSLIAASSEQRTLHMAQESPVAD